MSKARNRGRTVKRSELSNVQLRFMAVIDGGIVKRWNGICWVNDGSAPTPRQKGLLPVVVD
jgi:hypothetical protein